MLNKYLFKIEREILFMEWEGPVAMIDIDIPDAGHVAQDTVTAQSKPEAFEMMKKIATYKGEKMRLRVYETTGGLRGFITSHKISAVHLWQELEFAQHLLDKGQDPNYLLCCMAKCKFAVRLSPKWVYEKPRENEGISLYGVVNEDVPEIESSGKFVDRLVEIQNSFTGFSSEELIKALIEFRSTREEFFKGALLPNPWSLMKDCYTFPEGKKDFKSRVLVRDVSRWKRSLLIPNASWDFMSGKVISKPSVVEEEPRTEVKEQLWSTHDIKIGEAFKVSDLRKMFVVAPKSHSRRAK